MVAGMTSESAARTFGAVKNEPCGPSSGSTSTDIVFSIYSLTWSDPHLAMTDVKYDVLICKIAPSH